MMTTVNHLITDYLNSRDFLQLANSSQKSYESVLNKVRRKSVGGKHFGNLLLTELTVTHCRKLYDRLVSDISISSANHYSRIISVVLNYGVGLEVLTSNPLASVRKLRHTVDTPLWTRDQITQFLDEAYKSFDTRNTGLVIHMCYEWAQRPSDIRNLKWKDLNLDEAKVTIVQSKRGAVVTLPIEEPLLSLLKQQEEDWGFQPYVVTHHKPSGTVYKKLSKSHLATAFNKVKEACSLPSSLTVGVLRKVAINEFLEAGVDAPALMSVTGHKQVQSLNPYIKHRYETASNAMSKRRMT